MRIPVMLVAVFVCASVSEVQAGNVSAAGGAQSRVPSPLVTAHPSLAFTGLTADHTDYPGSALGGASITVRYYSPPSLEGGNKGSQSSVCNRPYSFPLQLLVRNFGQADFVPKDLTETVGITIGPWNGAKNLTTLPKGTSQIYDFSVSLPSGKYILRAQIVTNQDKSAAPNVHQLHTIAWPLEIKCDTTGVAPAPLNVGFRPSTVLGTIWWNNTVIPRNTGNLPKGPNGLFNSCAGLIVMLGHPTAFGPTLGNLQYLKYAERGSISECQFEFSQVPVDTDLAVGYTVDPGIFKVPVATPGQSHAFKIPASGNNSFNVRMELRPNIRPQLSH